MTAEIAIMNKMAVALAADSAVTISQEEEQKTYNTVNKLFGACCVKGFPKAGSHAILALAGGFVQQALCSVQISSCWYYALW